MNARRVVPWVAAALLVAGALCVGVRFYARRQMQLVHGDSVWRLTYTVDFRARRAGAKVHVAMPSDMPQARVFRQDLLYSGLAPLRSRPSRAANRESELATLRSGDYALSARFDIHLSPNAHWRASGPGRDPTAEDRAAWLRGTKTIQVDRPEVVKLATGLRRDAGRPPEFARRVFEYCSAELGTAGPEGPTDAAAVLAAKRGTPLGRARAMVALCRAGKVPARLVAGFEIRDAETCQPHVWIEALTNHHWEPFDPENGYEGELPHNFIPVRRDGTEIVRIADADDVQTTYSIVRLPPGAGMSRSGSHDPRDILDLTRLPLEMHEALAVILLMPLGALVTALARTVIGINTFGTFTPSLLALAFVYNDWRSGIFVFAFVILLGLMSRSLLDRLKLLMVPRLSVVLTLVVWCITLSVSVLDYFHLTPSAKAVLLPMVILTMTVERFYLTSEEDGPRVAFGLLTGTVALAACCYAVLRWNTVGNILLTYPEIHFFTIAVLILLGRYTGYRLSELWRFRDVVARS